MITFAERNFPTHVETRDLSRRELRKRRNTPQTNEYFVYALNEEDLVFNWVDQWFRDSTDVTDPYYAVTVWTVKKVDEQTSWHLYNREYNPFSIRIMNDLAPEQGKATSYRIKAMMHSIDDSSYGVWFKNLTLEQAEALRDTIAEYISSQLIFNGDAFFKFTESIGGIDFDRN